MSGKTNFADKTYENLKRMQLKSMNHQREYKWILFGAGAVAFLLSSGRWNVPVMAWIWPFCMLYFTRRSKKVYGLLIPCAVMVLLSAVKWYGCAAGTVPENIVAGFALGLTACIPLVIDFLFARKDKTFLATLIYPLSFAAVEFIMQLTPTATIGSISATQTGNDPLIQIASVFGSYGISILVVWLSSVLMYVLDNYRERSEKAKRAAAVYLSVFIAVFSFGGIRLAFADYTEPNIKVALTTGPYTGDFLSDEYIALSLEESIASVKQSAQTAAAARADILLFCEEAFTISDQEEAAMIEAVSEAAKENNIFVLIALEVEDKDNSQEGLTDNVEYLIDNSGKTVWKYYKSHLVNFVETGYVTEGKGVIPNKTVELPYGETVKLASVICMDSDFQTYVRDGLDNETDLFLVPTWDWEPIRAFHTKWAELRSVENGVSFVRSCMDGVSTATDQYGRVIMHSDTAGSGYENVVFAEVPVRALHTVYEIIGPVLDWLYVIGLAVLAGVGLIRRLSGRTL